MFGEQLVYEAARAQRSLLRHQEERGNRQGEIDHAKDEGARLARQIEVNASRIAQLANAEHQLRASLDKIPAWNQKQTLEAKVADAERRVGPAIATTSQWLDGLARLVEESAQLERWEPALLAPGVAQARSAVLSALGPARRFSARRLATALDSLPGNAFSPDIAADAVDQVSALQAPAEALLDALVRGEANFATALEHESFRLRGNSPRWLRRGAAGDRSAAALERRQVGGAGRHPARAGIAQASLPQAQPKVLCELVDPSPGPAGKTPSKASSATTASRSWSRRTPRRPASTSCATIRSPTAAEDYSKASAPAATPVTRRQLHPRGIGRWPPHRARLPAWVGWQRGQGARRRNPAHDCARYHPRGACGRARLRHVRRVRPGRRPGVRRGSRGVGASASCEEALGQAREKKKFLANDLRNQQVLAGKLRRLALPGNPADAELVWVLCQERADALAALARIDLTEAAALQAELDKVLAQEEVADGQTRKWQEEQVRHEVRAEDAAKRIRAIDEALPGLAADAANATARFALLESASAHRLLAQPLDAQSAALARDRGVPDASFPAKAATLVQDVGQRRAALLQAVGEYNLQAHEAERVACHLEALRPGDFEQGVRDICTVLEALEAQLRQQENIGIAQNKERLDQAKRTFHHVFTSDFCFRIRSKVNNGVETLRELNAELERLVFGGDRYRIEWSWVPQYQDYYRFFDAVHQRAEELGQRNLFDADVLAPELAKVRDELNDLLLSSDREVAHKRLKELADYRNYRRYEIFRESEAGGRVALSTWGTGSGGQLETPFYVVRSAVLSSAFRYFAKESCHLKLMLSDEAFAKMDEPRRRSVIQYLREKLGVQLIVGHAHGQCGRHQAGVREGVHVCPHRRQARRRSRMVPLRGPGKDPQAAGVDRALGRGGVRSTGRRPASSSNSAIRVRWRPRRRPRRQPQSNPDRRFRQRLGRCGKKSTPAPTMPGTESWTNR